MNPYEPSEELQDQFVDSLLQSAYENENDSSDREDRITAVLEQIETESIVATSPSVNGRGLRDRSRIRWITPVVVALALGLILFAFPFLSSGSDGQALAAVERSIAASQEFVLRYYRISQTTQSKSGKRITTKSDLYVKGSDKFAVRRPALMRNASVWAGSDGKDAWFVPAIGPIRVGAGTGLGKWLAKREDVKSPMLQIETMLARMKKGYELTQEQDEVLTMTDETTVTCQHLVGKLLLEGHDALPTRIDLWCDKETGTAIRVKTVFNPAVDRWGRAETTIDFVGEPELAENWFQASGHYEGFRRTRRFDSEDDQDPAEPSSDESVTD